VTRESLDDKARRYLTEGRIRLVRVEEGDNIDATVQGDASRPYVVTHRPSGWRCSCVSTVLRCSHVAAVALVTLAPEPGALRTPA
jgi:uncharacterized Zn finger protein